MLKMKGMKGSILAVLGMTVGVAVHAAPIATVGEIQGTVLVNQGKEYVAAHAGMPLGAGDRVLTMEGAGVAVVYQDHCVSHLKENSLLTLNNAQECSAHAGQITSVGPHYAAAIGGSPSADAVGGSAGVPPVVLPAVLPVAGVGVFAAGAAGAFSSGGGDSSLSPQ